MNRALFLLALLAIFAPFLHYAEAGELFDEKAGTWQGVLNNLDFSYVQKGDVYFGWNTGCDYGAWSHVALARETTTLQNWSYTYDLCDPPITIAGYGWSGLTIEATPTSNVNDIISRDCHRFWFYDKAACGYVNSASALEKWYAVAFCEEQSGSYDWNSDYYSNDTWQCAKLVMRAYDDATDGRVLLYLNYSRPPYLLLPEHIYYDNETTIYTESIAGSSQSTVMCKSDNLPLHAQKRLEEWKQKGLDTSRVEFKYGTHKDGFAQYLQRLRRTALENGMSEEEFVEAVKAEYNISALEYKEIINAGSLADR